MWGSGADFSDINAVDRSPNNRLLVTSDDFRRVKLYSFPCVKEGKSKV